MITKENPIRLLGEDLIVFRDDQGRPRVLGLHCSVKLIIQFLFIVSLATLAWTQETDWKQNWRQVVTAAQREGKVVVMGSADPVLRRELPARFKARFGLTLEYLAGRGTANFTRTGLYPTPNDLFVTLICPNILSVFPSISTSLPAEKSIT